MLKAENQTHWILEAKGNLNVIQALHFTYEEIKDRGEKKKANIYWALIVCWVSEQMFSKHISHLIFTYKEVVLFPSDKGGN